MSHHRRRDEDRTSRWRIDRAESSSISAAELRRVSEEDVTDASCTLLWKELSDHFLSPEQNLLQKSEAIKRKIQVLEHETKESLNELEQREITINQSVEIALVKVEETKKAALKVLKRARSDDEYGELNNNDFLPEQDRRHHQNRSAESDSPDQPSQHPESLPSSKKDPRLGLVEIVAHAEKPNITGGGDGSCTAGADNTLHCSQTLCSLFRNGTGVFPKPRSNSCIQISCW